MKDNELRNVASERAVLAGVCSYGLDSYVDVNILVDEKTFTIDHNKVLWKCLDYALKEHKTIDFSAILSASKSLNLDEYVNRKDVLQHINGILNTPINIDNVLYHAKKIRRLQFARDVQGSLSKIYSSINDISGDESLTSILTLAESPIQEICLKYIREDESNPKLIGKDLDEYFEYIKENKCEQIGISTGNACFDKAIGGGLRRKCVDVVGARPKALRHGSKVYTPNGHKNIEDIKIGDVVSHPFRGETTVAAIWPHHNIQIYRVYFRDGDYVDCCEDHLWHVNKRGVSDKEYLKTTKELIGDLKISDRQEYKWDIPLPNPVDFAEKPVPVDPYVLGILLGDGSVSNGTCVYHTMDNEIHEYMTSYANSIGLDVKIDQDVKNNKSTSYRINGMQSLLKDAGIFGYNCYNKFIPQDYIYNSIDVRMAVLAGLLDTDGDCTIDRLSKTSRTRFASVSYDLCVGVKEIVQSLGGLCSINKTKTKSNGKVFHSYRCEIRLPDGINPFRLKRKADKFTGRKIGKLKRTIVDIKKVGIDSARCITLSDDDGLFMTTNYVVTHNTGKSVFADNTALHIARQGIPVLMLDTEMSQEDHWNRLLANISEVDINDIATGKFSDNPEHLRRVKDALDEIKSIPYYYISIAGKPFEETLSVARRWILKNVGYNDEGKLNDAVLIYDYLKLMSADSITNNIAEFQALGLQITALHNFCVEYDCACLSFVQLNRDGITKESTDAVSGSDRIIWLCTSFSIFKAKTTEEIAMDGINNGNRKLIPIVSRHGPGIDDQGYICLNMIGEHSKLIEIGTIREIKANERLSAQGIPDQENIDPEDEIDDDDFRGLDELRRDE